MCDANKRQITIHGNWQTRVTNNFYVSTLFDDTGEVNVYRFFWMSQNTNDILLMGITSAVIYAWSILIIRANRENIPSWYTYVHTTHGGLLLSERHLTYNQGYTRQVKNSLDNIGKSLFLMRVHSLSGIYFFIYNHGMFKTIGMSPQISNHITITVTS